MLETEIRTRRIVLKFAPASFNLRQYLNLKSNHYIHLVFKSRIKYFDERK